MLWESSKPVSIPDTGRAFPIALEHVKLPCEVDVVAFPELCETPYLRARTIWSHDKPLLAGPVMVLRDSEHMGQFVMDHKDPGDRLDLSFGMIDTLSVRREMSKRTLNKDAARPKQECKILHYVSNTSDATQQIRIVERVAPELEAIIKTPQPGKPDEGGLIESELTLEPHQTIQLKLTYEIDARAATIF